MLTYNQILENRIKVKDIHIKWNIQKLTQLLISDYKPKYNKIDYSDNEVLNKYKEFIEVSGIDYDKLRAMNRKENIVTARKIIINELFYKGYSKSEIADFFNKDRTTIIHQIKNFNPNYDIRLKNSLKKFIKIYPESKLAKIYKGFE